MDDNKKINSIDQARWHSSIMATLLDAIESKEKKIEGIQEEINILTAQLNDVCKKVILSKFKPNTFVTHKNWFVFKLGEIKNCQIYTNSFVNLRTKKFVDGKGSVNVCRALSFVDNARIATEEEIQLYLSLLKEHRENKAMI